MLQRKNTSAWFVIGGLALAMLAILVLFQPYRGKHPTIAKDASVPFQSYPETERTLASTPWRSSKPSPQETHTPHVQSERREHIPSDPPVANEIAGSEEEVMEISDLAASLSDEDLEILKKLSPKDFLSDEDLERLDRKVAKSLQEYVEIVPKIVEHKAELRAIIVYSNNISAQEGWHEDNKKYEEVGKCDELIREMLVELRPLKIRASELESILREADVHSIGPQIDKEWLQRLSENISSPIVGSGSSSR